MSDADDKPVKVYQITDIDGVFVEPGLTGGVRVLLCVEGPHEIALLLPAEVLAKLEAKLAAAREFQAKRAGLQ